MVVSAQTSSRAAVAGNPSDGFGGAVCSVIVPHMSATATIVDKDTAAPFELVDAAIARFANSVTPVDVGVAISTTIPRSVGLAGSSAIVIATLRALIAHSGADVSAMQLAELAHAVERVDLGIAGGWQDQIIQSHGVSGLMEFSPTPRLEPIDMPQSNPIPLYIAWSATTAESSGMAHSTLREQRSPNDPVMLELAEHARSAAAAFATRSVHDLKAAIDATFDLRRQIMEIAPAQLAMVDNARSLGASANFAGSGGAIFGMLPKDGEAFLSALHGFGYDTQSWKAQ